MSPLREAAEEALRWMEHARLHLTIKERMHPDGLSLYDSAAEALRAALAQPEAEAEAEPVAWRVRWIDPEEGPGDWVPTRDPDFYRSRPTYEVRPLYAHPPRDEWRPASEPPEVTVLPDGSAFGMMSFPLPYDHWMYRDREYLPGADEPVDLPKPILTHALCEHVEAAVRYAVRGATNCGKELDFDPDALVLNAVYALCGPYGGASLRDIEPPTESTIAAKCQRVEGSGEICGLTPSCPDCGSSLIDVADGSL